jgi:hypothetical protein
VDATLLDENTLLELLQLFWRRNVCIKLMGLKSPIKLAPSFSVKGQCLPSLVVPDLWNAFAALTMSFFIISQHSLKKNPVNPSEPGAF